MHIKYCATFLFFFFFMINGLLGVEVEQLHLVPDAYVGEYHVNVDASQALYIENARHHAIRLKRNYPNSMPDVDKLADTDRSTTSRYNYILNPGGVRIVYGENELAVYVFVSLDDEATPENIRGSIKRVSDGRILSFHIEFREDGNVLLEIDGYSHVIGRDKK